MLRSGGCDFGKYYGVRKNRIFSNYRYEFALPNAGLSFLGLCRGSRKSRPRTWVALVDGRGVGVRGAGERPQAERGCQLKERIVGACKIFEMFRGAARLVGSGHVFGLCAKLGEFWQNSANIQKISATVTFN